MKKQLGNRLPALTPADFAILKAGETDFYGMNYYTSQFARHLDGPVPETDFLGAVHEHQEDKAGSPAGEESGIHWLRSCPDMFRKHLARVYSLYGKPIYITENGCPCPGEDKMTCEEAVNDPFRIRYFDSHLDSISKAITQDGVTVKGYFAWALLDNLGMYTIKPPVLINQPYFSLPYHPPLQAETSFFTFKLTNPLFKKNRMVRRLRPPLWRHLHRLQNSQAHAQEIRAGAKGHVC